MTRSGNATDAGLPTASRVALGTANASTTLAASALVPGSPVAADPPLLRCEAAAAGPGLPVALITTMVATAATTRPTGTRAATTGWRRRKRSLRRVTDRCCVRCACGEFSLLGCSRVFGPAVRGLGCGPRGARPRMWTSTCKRSPDVMSEGAGRTLGARSGGPCAASLLTVGQHGAVPPTGGRPRGVRSELGELRRVEERVADARGKHGGLQAPATDDRASQRQSARARRRRRRARSGRGSRRGGSCPCRTWRRDS